MDTKDIEASVKQKPGTRITPRTCLWPLAISLVVTFGLSIGLTFRSNHHCYAGTCGEWLFPLQARLHVVIWYSWLSLSTTFLAIRAFHPELQKVLARHVVERKLPLLKKTVSRGGLLMFCWVLCLYGTVIGVWWPRLHEYFSTRNAGGGITRGSNRLAAIALTGHLCDITMGMTLLPISRHSGLASFFGIAVSTTLANHMLSAYTLFTLVIIHGCLYVSWVPVFQGLSPELRRVIPVLNPTYLYNETWPGLASSLGIWRASLIFTGSAAALIMAALFMTTFQKIRVNHFNLFYFTHLFSIVMVVIICLHASTMFYCTAPGLAMWILDWSMRLHELRRKMNGEVVDVGRGWYCITLSIPRARLAGCSCRSPLAHFFIHHTESSIRELHPFTTITHLASQNDASQPWNPNIPIQFLFRKQGKRTLEPGIARLDKKHSLYRRLFHGDTTETKTLEWTEKLAGLSHSHEDEEGENTKTMGTDHAVDVPLRLEGPYFTPADPYRYNLTICLVAGTGISGALAIGSAFNHYSSRSAPMTPESASGAPRPRKWTRCIIIWSVKASDDIDLPFLEPLAAGLEVHKFVTGKENSRGRVDLEKEVTDLVLPERRGTLEVGRTWVYISGPRPYIASGKMACENAVKKGANLDYYAASWDP